MSDKNYFIIINNPLILEKKAGLMYLLLESSGILPECHIYYQTKSLFRHMLPVIGFQHSIALWKVHNKRKQIAQFLQRSFAQISAQTP